MPEEMIQITMVSHRDNQGKIYKSYVADIPEVNHIRNILSSRWKGGLDTFIDITDGINLGKMTIQNYDKPPKISNSLIIIYGDNPLIHNYERVVLIDESWRAGGKEYRAGYRLKTDSPNTHNSFIIIYDNRNLEKLFTTARINRILDKLEKLKDRYLKINTTAIIPPKENDKNLIYASHKGNKAMSMIATSDQTINIERWAKTNEVTANPSTNPLITGNLKNAEVKLFFKGDEVVFNARQKIRQPRTIEEVRSYLKIAWGAETFRVMFALTWYANQANKNRFTIRIRELCKLLGKTGGNERKELIETLDALQYSQLRLSEGPKTKGKKPSEYVLTPLLWTRIDYHGGGEDPSDIGVILWPQDETQKLGNVIISKEILSVRKNDLPLACYIFAEAKHHNNSKRIVLDYNKAIIAAQLQATNKRRKSEARTKLKIKLEKLIKLGVFDSVNVEYDGVELIKNKQKRIKAK